MDLIFAFDQIIHLKTMEQPTIAATSMHSLLKMERLLLGTIMDMEQFAEGN